MGRRLTVDVLPGSGIYYTEKLPPPPPPSPARNRVVHALVIILLVIAAAYAWRKKHGGRMSEDAATMSRILAEGRQRAFVSRLCVSQRYNGAIKLSNIKVLEG
jgi:hypothetical protein